MTADRATLLALAERAEKATGPDRELDAEIELRRVGRWEQVQRRVGGSLMWNAGGTEVLFYAPPITWSESWVPIPLYTASVDAALTLIPPDYMIEVMSEWRHPSIRAHGPWQAVLTRRNDTSALPSSWNSRCDHAASLAFAIVSAALRAMAAAQEDRPDAG